MTIDEAIKHAEKVAEQNEKISLYTPAEYIPADLSIEQCQNCAEEHRQLAEWLKELKDYRERIPSYEAGYNDAKREIALSGEYERAYERGKAENIEVLDKIRAELHATAEMHEDGNYYLREEWIDEIFDKYRAERSDKE